jgi:hypothetical protein
VRLSAECHTTLVAAMNTAPDRFTTHRALLGFMAVALILHLPVLGLSFLSDDLTILYRIGERNDLGTGSFFRPLPDWTHWLTYRIVGPTPWVFRTVNVLLLGFNAWLMMLLARRMAERTLLPEGPVWAVLAGILYVLYPFHLEPQVWIVGRSTAMASSFVLLAMWTALGTAPVWQRSVQVALWTFLGALCYEHALLIPGMLLIVWLVLEPRHPREWLPMIISASLVVGLNLALRSWASGAVANTYGSAFFQRNGSDYLGGAMKVAGRLFLPPEPDARGQTLRMGLLAVLLIALGFLWWRRSRKGPVHGHLLGALLMMTALASVIAVVGGVSTRTSESDRFLYLPSAFLCLAIALLLVTMTTGRIRTLLTIALVVLEGIGLWSGQGHWRTASATLERIVEQTPDAASGKRVFVMGLPGDHRGAYILRHGYLEALLFAGRDTTGISRADTLLRGLRTTDQIPALAFEAPLDTLYIRPADRIVFWNGTRFLALPSH